ncbi:MAG TPA: rhodanese-like domain-containing protein [Rubricoccaceae bacterium]|nr:rhodanese-like domain-containing protein [Rubricoccaceae bacterium]
MNWTVKDLVGEANAQVRTYSVPEAASRLGEADVVFVDVRDEPELVRDGKIPGAVHASRGMLEFYIDPGTPYHMDVFDSGKEIIFYCKSGGRSALAAQRAQEMGVPNVAHVEGGLNAWKEADGPVEAAA